LIGKVKARGVGEMMARVGGSLPVDTSSAGMELATIVKEENKENTYDVAIVGCGEQA
jgi:hypothetical protein